MMNLVTFQGRHRNGRGVSTIYFAAGGYGALDGTDGVPTVPHPSNMAVVPVEIWETITSTTIERKELLTDSGGAGQWRGGMGQEVVVRNDSGSTMTLLGMGNRTQFPARGLFKGQEGSMRVHAIDGTPINAKARVELQAGARLTVREAGAGGFGDPLKRDPARAGRCPRGLRQSEGGTPRLWREGRPEARHGGAAGGQGWTREGGREVGARHDLPVDMDQGGHSPPVLCFAVRWSRPLVTAGGDCPGGA